MEGCVGEESFQMWELNRRLEAYLARVKALEEQNEGLSAELGGLRARAGDDASWRARADGELTALRALVEERWREKHAAELERDRLAAELEGVAGRCERLRLARARTAEEAARSRREIEAETCARDRLGARAAALERELEALRAAHEEERTDLHAQAARAPRRPAPPRASPAPAPDVEELARRLGDAWRGAVRGYQERVAHMETSLAQARERLAGAVQGAREARLEVQQLGAERDGLQERRAALEQRLEGRWQERLRATEKFQLAVESLEQEKQGLQSQIAQVLEGRQQLAHLKMSLSLEVATYRTLLEAENSRLQTPGGTSHAPLGFQDLKVQQYFPGTTEGRRLGPVLPILSPTPLPSPLPNTLETPVPVFLKSQEFLQAQPPTLASTPISPTPQASCPATHAEVRTQDASPFQLQTQGGGQPTLEPLLAEAKVAAPASVPPEVKEPGVKHPEGGTDEFSEEQTSLASLLDPDHPTLEVTHGLPSGSRVSHIFQEESEWQTLGPVEIEAAKEVKKVSSLWQETQQEGSLDMEEIQAAQSPLGNDIRKALGKESQTHETVGNHKSPSSLENGDLEIPKSLEKQTSTKSLDRKAVEEGERPLVKETPELPMPTGREDPQTSSSPSLEQENEELLRSPETVSFLEKENQEVVRSTEESLALDQESQQQPRSVEAEGEETRPPEENQDFLTTPEGDQDTFKPPGKENQEPVKYLEDQRIERPLERENQEPPRSPEKEWGMIERSLERENQESPRSPEEEGQMIERPLERENQESLRSPEEEGQMIERSLERENQEPPKSSEEEEGMIEGPLEKVDEESLRSMEEDDIEGLLEQENLESLRSLKEEDQKVERSLERENQESLRSLEEDEMNLESLRSLKEEDQRVERPLEKESLEYLKFLEDDDETKGLLEKENLESLRSLEEEDQRVERPLEKETQESLKFPEEEDQEVQRSLEPETQQPPLAVGEAEWITPRPLQEWNSEPLRSPGEDQEMNHEGSAETMRLLETENPQPLKTGGEKDLELGKCREAQEAVWSLEEMSKGVVRPPEDDIQEPLGCETLNPPGEDSQELRSLDKRSPEWAPSPERAEQERGEDLKVGERLERRESPEPPRSLEEEGQELSQEDQEVGQSPPQGGPGAESEEQPELYPWQGARGEAWSLGNTESEEQRVPAEEASGKGGAECLQDPKGQQKQVETLGLGAAQEIPEVVEPQGSDQASLEVTLRSEVVRGQSALGDGLSLEEVLELGEPGPPTREQYPPMGEEDSEAEIAEGSQGPGKHPEETGASEAWLSELTRASSDTLESPKGREELLSVETSGHENREAPQPRSPGSEDEEDVHLVLGPPGPKPIEPYSATPVLEDATQPQPQAEESQEAGWGLEGRAEALGSGESEQEFGPVEIPEGVQEEEEEEEEQSREESEADELGETLPDSTPLGLYLRSPVSPKCDLAGEQRSPSQGEAEESSDPAVQAPQGLRTSPSEEEEEEEDGDLLEEFEDLENESSPLPEVSRDMAEPRGQLPPQLEPAGWERDGESDGFADEEESGEEAEEEEEAAGPGGQWWGPRPSVDSLQALGGSQRGDFLEPGADSSVTVLETKTPGSDGPSGSEEESDAASLDREDGVLGSLDGSRRVEGVGAGTGDTCMLIGQGPSMEELEHVNGNVLNGLVKSDVVGQGVTQGALDGHLDQGLPLQEKEGTALKTPWVGSPVSLGQGQFLKFTPREADGDSWSSGED